MELRNILTCLETYPVDLEQVEIYKKWGFTIRAVDPPEQWCAFAIDGDRRTVTLEDLPELIKDFPCGLIVNKDSITIFDDYL